MRPRLSLAFLLSIATSLAAQKAPNIKPYLIADRAAEVELARTAAPRAITSKATVLVLTRAGYVEAVHGTNGFTCAVMRSFAGAPDDPQFWNPHTLAPLCMNPPAVRTILPTTLTEIGWTLAGATPADLTAKIAKAYASKTFSLPAVGAMAYMLSPKQHLTDDDNPHWMPHLMFYYERSASGVFGAGADSTPILDLSGPTSKSPVRVILIPTRTWSDGTAATGH
jgi:hypothetical protein